jgi:hypothetical protein
MKLERAISIAAAAHSGQTDKAGEPYILHPVRVMLAAEGDDARVVAVLHDVIEDSDWSIERLVDEGLTNDQAAALDSVTRREGESYADFIDRAGSNPLGRSVKILDLQDNSDMTRILHPAGRDRSRLERYLKALHKLDAHLGPPSRADLLQALTAACHALRSYQFDNGSPDLAEEIADHCESLLARESSR